MRASLACCSLVATQRARSLWIGVVSLLVIAAGCSEEVGFERSAAECSDGKDNDGDGLVDCVDPDCRARPECLPDASLERRPDAGKPDAPGPRETGLGDSHPGEASAPDAPSPIAEQEPNDGKTTTEFQPIALPVQVDAAIGIADDTDLFGLQATAGDRLSVTVRSAGSLEPHLAVFGDSALNVPAGVTTGGAGTTVLAEYYVLKSGSYYVGVRDRRNVGSSSQHVGGSGFGYLLSVMPLSRAPIPATVGGEASAMLDPPGTVAVFSFTATPNDALELSVLAARLTPPSDVDSRLSIFHPGQGAYLGTNDNLSASQTDSLLKGTFPFSGVYHAIVENEGPWGGSNMKVTLKITKQ